MPDGEGETSEHLSSRFEVEQVLQATGILPDLALRDDRWGKGSSLKILINLVRRLPVMGLPSWSAFKRNRSHTGCSSGCICVLSIQRRIGSLTSVDQSVWRIGDCDDCRGNG